MVPARLKDLVQLRQPPEAKGDRLGVNRVAVVEAHARPDVPDQRERVDLLVADHPVHREQVFRRLVGHGLCKSRVDDVPVVEVVDAGVESRVLSGPPQAQRPSAVGRIRVGRWGRGGCGRCSGFGSLGSCWRWCRRYRRSFCLDRRGRRRVAPAARQQRRRPHRRYPAPDKEPPPAHSSPLEPLPVVRTSAHRATLVAQSSHRHGRSLSASHARRQLLDVGCDQVRRFHRDEVAVLLQHDLLGVP